LGLPKNPARVVCLVLSCISTVSLVVSHGLKEGLKYRSNDARAQRGGREMNVLVFRDFLRHFARHALGSASILQVTDVVGQRRDVGCRPTNYLALG